MLNYSRFGSAVYVAHSRSMSHVVKMFLDAIAMLESFINESNTSSEYSESLRLIDRAREVVQDEFELDISCQRKRRSPQERSLQKAKWYQKKLRLEAQRNCPEFEV